MDIFDAIRERHSVRSYKDKAIEGETLKELLAAIEDCNRDSGLHIQLVMNEPKAFDSFLGHYGNFKGVKNYIAMVGKKGSEYEELCGYYGEKIVLIAQMLGLNTCWVKSTYKKISKVFSVEEDEKLHIVIAIGYGENCGVPHKSKDISEVSRIIQTNQSNVVLPAWFNKGMDAVMLAPTAINQQNFLFVLEENTVKATSGLAVCGRIDLGIAKYHFEIGAGDHPFTWV